MINQVGGKGPGWINPHRKGKNKSSPEATDWELPRLNFRSNKNFLQKQNFFKCRSQIILLLILSVYYQGSALQRKNQGIHFYEIHSLYEIFKGTQETNVQEALI